MIALTTYGRSGVRHLALGSVTEDVVRVSGDPVLVVRSDSPANELLTAPQTAA